MTKHDETQSEDAPKNAVKDAEPSDAAKAEQESTAAAQSQDDLDKKFGAVAGIPAAGAPATDDEAARKASLADAEEKSKAAEFAENA